MPEVLYLFLFFLPLYLLFRNIGRRWESLAEVFEGSATDLARDAFESLQTTFGEALAGEREEVCIFSRGDASKESAKTKRKMNNSTSRQWEKISYR